MVIAIEYYDNFRWMPMGTWTPNEDEMRID